ncbi:MAG: hypothetical protein LBR81_04125 [Prevotellaceae bacterium]|jgi:hypothetical protein|nr:hypothetical protein [Prevotellaceae bacterium]
MNTTPRNYHCKDEELPVICRFVHLSLQRDLADFTAYSPKFNDEYAAAFKTNIDAVAELAIPATETKELKRITAQLNDTMDKLAEPLLHLEGYIKLAKAELPLSVADFGISPLRKKIHGKDAEGVLHNLRIVAANIQKYETVLTEQGMNKEFKTQIETALASITTDNEQQNKIISSRRILAEENLNQFNELYEQLTEICNIGKIIYKTSQPGKALDYTFADLKKKVRLERKPETK